MSKARRPRWPIVFVDQDGMYYEGRMYVPFVADKAVTIVAVQCGAHPLVVSGLPQRLRPGDSLEVWEA